MTKHIVREYTRTCHFCGDTFISGWPAAKFCSNKHRQQMYRWRKRLPFLFSQSAHWIGQFDNYLRFPDSRPHAIDFLKQIKQVIDELYREHKVTVVRNGN